MHSHKGRGGNNHNEGHGHGNHKHGLGLGAKQKTDTTSTPPPPMQDATLIAHADKKHPRLAALAEKIQDDIEKTKFGLQQFGQKVHDARQERIAEDAATRARAEEEVRREFARKEAQERHASKHTTIPEPSTQRAVSNKDQEYEKYMREGRDLMRAALLFTGVNRTSYTAAIAKFTLAFGCIATVPPGTQLLWALAGISVQLSNKKAAEAYVAIAECYLAMQDYDMALNYLKPLDFYGSPILDIKTRIEICQMRKQKQSSVSFEVKPAPTHYSTQETHHSYEPPPSSQRQTQTDSWAVSTSTYEQIQRAPEPKPAPILRGWDLYKEDCIRTARELLTQDPDNQTTLSTVLSSAMSMVKTPTPADYTSLLPQLNKCLETFKRYCTRPTSEESILMAKLEAFQAKVDEMVNGPERRRIAALAEQAIYDLLREAQDSLDDFNLDNALLKVADAKNLARRSHQKYMTDQNYRDDQYFSDYINSITREKQSFENKKTIWPVELAITIIQQAMPILNSRERKRLFWVHNDRLREDIAEELRLHWDKFHVYTKEQFMRLSMFNEMVELIRRNFEPISWAKYTLRRGWNDHMAIKKEHSHNIGPVLRDMVRAFAETRAAYRVSFRIFALSTEQAVDQSSTIPIAQAAIYDWQQTLENGGIRVLAAVQPAHLASAASAVAEYPSAPPLVDDSEAAAKKGPRIYD